MRILKHQHHPNLPHNLAINWADLDARTNIGTHLALRFLRPLLGGRFRAPQPLGICAYPLWGRNWRLTRRSGFPPLFLRVLDRSTSKANAISTDPAFDLSKVRSFSPTTSFFFSSCWASWRESWEFSFVLHFFSVRFWLPHFWDLSISECWLLSSPFCGEDLAAVANWSNRAFLKSFAYLRIGVWFSAMQLCLWPLWLDSFFFIK